MKKIIISGLFCLATVYTFGQDVYRYFRGQKISYKVSTTEMLVKLKTPDIAGVKKALQNSVAGHLKKMDNLDDGLLFFIEMEKTNKEDVWKLQRQVSSREDVIYTSPVFGDEPGPKTGYTNEVMITLKSKDDYPVLLKYTKVYHIKDIKACEYFPPETYKLTLPHNSEKDAMQTANELYETGLFKYVEPNYIHIQPFAFNDTYYPNQWGLKNTGQSGGTAGIDIKGEKAMSNSRGTNVKIAIVDTGVDLNHPDLVNNLLPGYDAYTHSNNGGAPTNTDSGDFPHGTKCAGVAAARGKNNKGIIGVACEGKIIPITAGASGVIYSNASAEGINWARHNGANVISMSYGGSTSIYVQAALDSAITFGNNGRGCVLVACAHNQGNTSNPSVRFPANDENVIAVGAILNNGQRASYSNYGPDLDVVAPGEGIYTTGMLGATQNTIINNGADGVYFPDFGGTSAATPFVAGAAALMLSANPVLTAAEVRSIIRMTAQKLNGYAFTTTSAHPDGSWNNEVGYGLLDALAAVQAANCTSSNLVQSVWIDKFIRSCNDNYTILSNITVGENINLTIKAEQVTINPVFEVRSGTGQFEIR